MNIALRHADTLRRVRAVLTREWVSPRWVEVRVLAAYPDSDSLAYAPDTFAVQQAIRKLVETGVAEHDARYRVRLAG